MHTFLYDQTTGFISLVDEQGKNMIHLTQEFSSEPTLSPDKRSIAYISPLEWETPSLLYVVELDLIGIKKLDLGIDINKETIRDVVWLDNENVAVIIGELRGNFAIGGNVYRYNINNDDRVALTYYDLHRQQAVKLKVKDGMISHDAIRYTNSDGTSFTKIEGTFATISQVI